MTDLVKPANEVIDYTNDRTDEHEDNRDDFPKPCPWCGEEPKVDRFYDMYLVTCMNYDCPVMPLTKPMRTERHAIYVWNRRA